MAVDPFMQRLVAHDVVDPPDSAISVVVQDEGEVVVFPSTSNVTEERSSPEAGGVERSAAVSHGSVPRRGGHRRNDRAPTCADCPYGGYSVGNSSSTLAAPAMR